MAVDSGLDPRVHHAQVWLKHHQQMEDKIQNELWNLLQNQLDRQLSGIYMFLYQAMRSPGDETVLWL